MEYCSTKAMKKHSENFIKLKKSKCVFVWIVIHKIMGKYDGWLLYFEVREQKQILIVENQCIVF